MDMTRVKNETIKVHHPPLRVKVKIKQTENAKPERNI